MNRRQAAIVAGVHGLQHVDGFAAANFADHDAIGTHAQSVANQIALRHFASTFDIGRPSFQADHVRLLQLQFSRVFDRDDAFVFGNVGRKRVQQESFCRRRCRRKSARSVAR